MTLSSEDIVAIQQLAAAYNHAVDAGDGDRFAATFTSDGCLITGQEVKGHEALAAFAESVPQMIPGPRHVLSNLLCDGTDDSATLAAYVHVYAKVGGEGPPALITAGTYSDTLRRVSGKWLFEKRTFTPD
ncbi:MAG: hypothetical protein JWO63_1875 [Frankiales bacterium]|jgi:uncharacterized protein (TIGR02246 family)|nr:hypothetical protein [Frankiales bacterium]